MILPILLYFSLLSDNHVFCDSDIYNYSVTGIILVKMTNIPLKQT